MWSSARSDCIVRERRTNLTWTPAKHMNKEQWRSLCMCRRILSLAHPLQMSKNNGNTSEMLSTTLPYPSSAKISAKSADWFEAHSEEMTPAIEAKRKTPWQQTKAIPVSRTSRFSVLLAEKSSCVPGNAPMTTGFSSAPRFRLQLTPATSRRCMMASSRQWARRQRKLPFEISHRGGDSRQRTTVGVLGRTLHWAIYIQEKM